MSQLNQTIYINILNYSSSAIYIVCVQQYILQVALIITDTYFISVTYGGKAWTLACIKILPHYDGFRLTL